MSDIETLPAKKGKATEVSGNIASILVSLRERYHLTQRSIADMLGVSFQQYQKYEKAKDRLSLEKAMRLADHLGLSLDIFQGSDQATGFAESEQAAFGETPVSKGLNTQEQEWLQLLRHASSAKERSLLIEQARATLKKSAKN